MKTAKLQIIEFCLAFTLVVAGEFGNKMIQALEQYHIRHVKKKGVVDHAVQTIIQDR